ncbi:hypothetical protein [Photobacterium nomapromontoriensis]|uniref:hypothetical protein n=1 Tax=Photobacterium nomapromontoriensis TaxID=2910237 RepID=UPI003D0EA2CD
MNWELVIKVISAVVTILGLIKIFSDLSTTKRTTLQNNYKFIKEFLNDINEAESNDKPLHPFVLEKGYQALAGTDTVSSREVKYILTLQDSSQCLHDFIFAKTLFDRLSTDGDLKIKFRKKYNKIWIRNSYKVLTLVSYVVLAFISISPLIFMTYLNLSLSQMATILIVTFPIFGFFAYISLNNFSQFIRAERLYNNQEKYIKIKIITAHK